METVRVTVGLATAVLLPRSLPYVSRSLFGSVLVSLAFGLYVLAINLVGDRKIILLAVSVLWSLVSTIAVRRKSQSGTVGVVTDAGSRSVEEITIILKALRRAPRAVLRPAYVAIPLAAGTTLTFSLVTNAHATRRFLSHTLVADQVCLVAAGMLIAIFICHEPVVRISSRATGTAIQSHASLVSVDQPGIYIGWFERAVVFAFVAGGAADAAGLALAAKSLARYPAIEKGEIKGEYFLIGTFLSVLAAALVAIGIRLALGLAPL